MRSLSTEFNRAASHALKFHTNWTKLHAPPGAAGRKQGSKKGRRDGGRERERVLCMSRRRGTSEQQPQNQQQPEHRVRDCEGMKGYVVDPSHPREEEDEEEEESKRKQFPSTVGFVENLQYADVCSAVGLRCRLGCAPRPFQRSRPTSCWPDLQPTRQINSVCQFGSIREENSVSFPEVKLPSTWYCM